RLQSGQLVATVEATKAAVELYATFEGTVIRVDCKVGDEVEVGAPLIWLDSVKGRTAAAPQTETSWSVTLRRRPGAAIRPIETSTSSIPMIGLGAIGIVGGSRVVPTEHIAQTLERRSAPLIVLTGIRERRWIGDEQTLLGMAT